VLVNEMPSIRVLEAFLVVSFLELHQYHQIGAKGAKKLEDKRKSSFLHLFQHHRFCSLDSCNEPQFEMKNLIQFTQFDYASV
jgi:hypothetical protein